jgi:hypothetical protein
MIELIHKIPCLVGKGKIGADVLCRVESVLHKSLPDFQRLLPDDAASVNDLKEIRRA